MHLFRHEANDEADEVRWLAPTQVRQRPRRRLLPFSLLATAVIASGVLAFVSFRLSPPDAAPPQPVQRAEPPAAVQAPAPNPPPDPSLRAADATPTAPQAPAPPEVVTPDIPAPEAEKAPSTSLAGAFPPAAAPTSLDPDAPDFAAYLNESAPDQASAQTLVAEVQRRYASLLDGGRLSYRRVQLADGSNVWRLRLPGLTRTAAERICASLAGQGAGCEVGPR